MAKKACAECEGFRHVPDDKGGFRRCSCYPHDQGTAPVWVEGAPLWCQKATLGSVLAQKRGVITSHTKSAKDLLGSITKGEMMWVVPLFVGPETATQELAVAVMNDASLETKRRCAYVKFSRIQEGFFNRERANEHLGGKGVEVYRYCGPEFLVLTVSLEGMAGNSYSTPIFRDIISSRRDAGIYTVVLSEFPVSELVDRQVPRAMQDYLSDSKHFRVTEVPVRRP